MKPTRLRLASRYACERLTGAPITICSYCAWTGRWRMVLVLDLLCAGYDAAHGHPLTPRGHCARDAELEGLGMLPDPVAAIRRAGW